MIKSKLKEKHTFKKYEIINYNGDNRFIKLKLNKKDKRFFNKRLRRCAKKYILLESRLD